MPNIKRLVQAKLVKEFMPRPTLYPGLLGDTDGNVYVGGVKDGHVYFRTSRGDVHTAWNDRVQNVYNLPIMYGMLNGHMQIIETRDVYKTPKHGVNIGEHNLNHAWPGSDVVNIWAEQFMPFLLNPNGNLEATLYHSNIYTDLGELVEIQDTDIDFADYTPTNANWIILSIDDNGDVLLTEGDDVAGASYLNLGNIPTFEGRGLWAIKRWDDQTLLRRTYGADNELFDLRFSQQPGLPGMESNSVLANATQSWATPQDIYMLEDTVLGRLRGGQINDLYGHEIRTILNNFDGTGFENRTDSTITISTRTVTVAPAVTSFNVFSEGRKFTKTGGATCQTTIPATVGVHFIYFDITGTLRNTMAAWSIIGDLIPAAIVFWNGSAALVYDERHSYRRNQFWHKWAHDTIGCLYESGLVQTYPTTADDGLTQIDAGEIHDEDIDFDITPEQKTIAIFYQTTGAVWTFALGTDNGGYDRPYIWNAGTSRIRYPKSDSAYALTDVGLTDFYIVYVYATLCTTRPIHIVVPAATAAYNNIGDARSAPVPNLSGVVSPEMKLIYRWIFKGDGQYQEGSDYRLTTPLPSGGSVAINATSVTSNPVGGISATNVQAALEELDTEKVDVSGAITAGHVAIFVDANTVEDGGEPGTGGGHVIQDEGSPLTNRSNLNFVGSMIAVTDDVGNDATVVTITPGAGDGDVLGPASNTDGTIPYWVGADSKELADGYAVETTVGDPGSDWSIPTEQAVREALDAMPGGGDVTGPGVHPDAYIPYWVGANTDDLGPGYELKTTLATPGADDKLATEKAIRTAITASSPTIPGVKVYNHSNFI